MCAAEACSDSMDLGHTIVYEQLAASSRMKETRSNFLLIVKGSDSVTNAIINSMYSIVETSDDFRHCSW